MNEKIPVHRIDLVDSSRMQPTANSVAYPDIHANANRAGSDIHACAFRHSGDSSVADCIYYRNIDGLQGFCVEYRLDAR